MHQLFVFLQFIILEMNEMPRWTLGDHNWIKWEEKVIEMCIDYVMAQINSKHPLPKTQTISFNKIWIFFGIILKQFWTSIQSFCNRSPKAKLGPNILEQGQKKSVLSLVPDFGMLPQPVISFSEIFIQNLLHVAFDKKNEGW